MILLRREGRTARLVAGHEAAQPPNLRESLSLLGGKPHKLRRMGSPVGEGFHDLILQDLVVVSEHGGEFPGRRALGHGLVKPFHHDKSTLAKACLDLLEDDLLGPDVEERDQVPLALAEVSDAHVGFDGLEREVTLGGFLAGQLEADV